MRIIIEVDDQDGTTIPLSYQGEKGEQGIPGDTTPEYIALAEQIESDRVAVAVDKEIVLTDKATIEGLAGQVASAMVVVATDKIIVAGYKNAAEAARDEAVELIEQNFTHNNTVGF